MRLHIFRTRMAMQGQHFSFDGLVPLMDVPHRATINHTQVRDGVQYVSFAEATRPVEILAMSPGLDRYEAWLAHETAANAALLVLARQLYPELETVPTWPMLWVECPDPRLATARHDVRFSGIEVTR